MRISPFFLQLRSAYQSEMDDLAFDSEGRNVLRQRLAERRKEFGFLLQMIELSPEMVAVIFHQGFRFKLPAVMDHLLTHESDEFPDWDSLVDAAHLTPWAHELTQVILKEPMGAWFLTVAAGLEYMYSKPDTAPATQNANAGEEGDEDDEDDDSLNEFDAEEEKDARAREEAGADWMVEQGFDRKD
ncbi:hypothetical protein [Rhodoferax sp. UBA5149]|uniref:hypothetical protein n=1 Tax=Rhodoferax sp. UBA5149 TaxID=1947379 RepID=UPI0025DE8152|nr:hypothetical protein [Rhodoferax sp. UBA5149]